MFLCLDIIEKGLKDIYMEKRGRKLLKEFLFIFLKNNGESLGITWCLNNLIFFPLASISMWMHVNKILKISLICSI